MSEPVVEVLLVEDHDIDAEMILRSLQKARPGVAVLRLRGGQEAIDFLGGAGAHGGRQPGAPKLMLLDVNIPQLDGIGVLRRIKAAGIQGTRIVMLTHSAEDHTIVESRRIGAHGYLVKPVAVDTLRRVIGEAGLGPAVPD